MKRPSVWCACVLLMMTACTGAQTASWQQASSSQSWQQTDRAAESVQKAQQAPQISAQTQPRSFSGGSFAAQDEQLQDKRLSYLELYADYTGIYALGNAKGILQQADWSYRNGLLHVHLRHGAEYVTVYFQVRDEELLRTLNPDASGDLQRIHVQHEPAAS